MQIFGPMCASNSLNDFHRMDGQIEMQIYIHKQCLLNTMATQRIARFENLNEIS